MGKKVCLNCDTTLIKRAQIKYCSNLCQTTYQNKRYIELWKKNGSSKYTKNIPKPLKRYLIEKCKNQCSKCGWNQKHPVTNRVPLEVDHIDGNAFNNTENNLRLLCPNCHALTTTFKNLNKGNGRNWRMRTYTKK